MEDSPRLRPGRATTIGLVVAAGLALGLGIVVAVFVTSGPQRQTITKTTTAVSTLPVTTTVTATRLAPDPVEQALRRLRRLAGPDGGPLPLP